MKRFLIFLLILCLCAGCYAPPSPEKILDVLQELTPPEISVPEESSSDTLEESSSEEDLPPEEDSYEDTIPKEEFEKLPLGQSRLYDSSGRLYQIGWSTDASYANPFFDLYYSVPYDAYVWDEEYTRRCHSYWELGESAAIEFVSSWYDDSTTMLLFVDQVSSDFDLNSYVSDYYTAGSFFTDNLLFSTVTLAGKNFLRYAPAQGEDVFYFYVQDGILLTIELWYVQTVPDSEDTWISGFETRADYMAPDSYQPPVYAGDSYENRWLDLSFDLPMFLNWAFDDTMYDTDTFSYELAASSYYSDFYMMLTTEVPAFPDCTAAEYLDQLWMPIADEAELLQYAAPVTIAGKEFLLLEYREPATYTPAVHQYYVYRLQDRIVLLYIFAYDQKASLIPMTLASFHIAGTDLYSHEPYVPGALSGDIYSNPHMNLQLSNYQLYDGQLLCDLYLSGHSPLGLTEQSDALTQPDFECLAMTSKAASQLTKCSVLVYSEQIDASSYMLHDYFITLRDRGEEIHYTVDSALGTAWLGGKQYMTVFTYCDAQMKYAYRKYYYRIEGDRIFCIALSANEDTLESGQRYLYQLVQE